MHRPFSVAFFGLAVTGCGAFDISSNQGAAGSATSPGASGSPGGTSSGGISSGGISSGGISSGGTSAAGTSSSAGAGGSLTAGGGANGSVVRGAASVNILAPVGCPQTAQYQDFPVVASGHPITATDNQATIGDQEIDSDGSAAIVTCNWFDGSMITVQGEIRLGPLVKLRVIDFTVQMGTNGSGDGEILFASNQLHDEYTAQCTYSALQADSTTHSIRGTFSCSSLDPVGTTGSCAVGTSYFAFDNCKEVKSVSP